MTGVPPGLLPPLAEFVLASLSFDRTKMSLSLSHYFFAYSTIETSLLLTLSFLYIYCFFIEKLFKIRVLKFNYAFNFYVECVLLFIFLIKFVFFISTF